MRLDSFVKIALLGRRASAQKLCYDDEAICAKKVVDTRKKSIVKAMTFRIMATILTTVAFWLFTGNVELSAGFGAVDFITKLALYYAHERAWVNFESRSTLFKRAMAMCGIKF